MTESGTDGGTGALSPRAHEPADFGGEQLPSSAAGHGFAAGRVAVVGDVGGHRCELVAELLRLGANPQTLALPADLTVVQVGDLVHRGPDSEGVVALVDRYLHETPRRWVQLAGNHEAQYLREPVFRWPVPLEPHAAEQLRRWWSTGRMHAAAAIGTPRGDVLVTHAGLTEGYWRVALGEPPTAQQAAAALNSFIGTHEEVLFAPGHMLGGGPASGAAGPIWAAAATELIPSWLHGAAPMPFGQVHGHSSVTDWRRRQLRGAPEVAVLVHRDSDAAHETATLPGGRQIIGVDPGHGRRAHHPWRALVLPGAVVEPLR